MIVCGEEHVAIQRDFSVLKSLGGCGGTIVCRQLAAAGWLVLSEVNPRSACLYGGGLNPLEQLRRNRLPLPEAWLSVDSHLLGDPAIFGRFIAELIETSQQPVVIRDYSYIDYIGTPFVWPTPLNASLTPALHPFGLTHVALLVRHPSDCYKSLLGHPPLSRLSPEAFVRGHLAMYADNPSSVRIRFEDFIVDLPSTMNDLCEALAIAPPASWLDNLANAPRLTGNKRAQDATTIESISRKARTAIDDELEAVSGFDYLLTLGDYKSVSH